MKQRQLGPLRVSEIGMGCMGFSHGYGKIPEESYSIQAIRKGVEAGCTFFDTAEVYSPNLEGMGHNERIVGKALEPYRQEITIATKIFFRQEIPTNHLYEEMEKRLQASLQRLKTDHLDLYYLHHVHPDIPVEAVAEIMGQFIQKGWIRAWGLSNVDVDTIQKSHSITTLSAVQNIYSLVERDAEAKILPYCQEQKIGFVPFSPIASGLLSGKITEKTEFEKYDDVRNWVPQLSKENITGNQALVNILRNFAKQKQATPAQISLAWMLHKYPHVVPIPGSKNKERILENLEASTITLTKDEFSSLEEAIHAYKVYGHRGCTD